MTSGHILLDARLAEPLLGVKIWIREWVLLPELRLTGRRPNSESSSSSSSLSYVSSFYLFDYWKPWDAPQLSSLRHGLWLARHTHPEPSSSPQIVL
mmetsp:Transcript_42416/g.91540  ORF Transcript_42416/g.91540 Transcript_42416/m.91540 type:complete len:96 (-) Transcript_42416:10-297(-)